MRSRTDQTLITAALRDLDPGNRTDLTAEERDRAEAALARIVVMPVNQPVKSEPDPAPRRWRLLAPTGLVAAAAIAVPMVIFGGGTAYGTWTPTPTPLTGAAATEAADTCRAAIERSRMRMEGAVGSSSNPDSPLGTAVAERRGGWTYLLLAAPGAEGICLMPNHEVGKVKPGAENLFVSYGTGVDAPPILAPDRVVYRTRAEGSTEEGRFNWVEGYVGSDVIGVTVHTASGLDIQASVVDNRFAAWWPAESESSSATETETLSYTVHLGDGTTRRTD